MDSLSLSVRATPRTPITPRTPKTLKKHHNKHEPDNIPSQRFKVGYQKVTLDIDLEQNSIVGETEITILPQDSHLKQVKLDCRGIQIKSIIVNQRRAQYTYDDFLQNQEYMNDPDNPVLSDYNYDPYFDSNSKNISISQHEMLRTKFFPLFSDQNNPADSSSSYSACTSELTIKIPESIKLRLQNSAKGTFSPIGTNRSINETPNTTNTLFNSDKVYTPLNIKINYIVKNSKNGIQFYGGKHTDIPKHLWYCYTLNNDFGCSASSWVPCIDNFHEKPAWDINIVVPKTIGDIGTSKIIGSKEAEKALRKMALQQLDIDETQSQASFTENIHDLNKLASSENNEDADGDDEAFEEKIENSPLVVVVPDLVSFRESPHPIDVAKKLVNFQFYNPVSAHHLGFAVGCFEKIPIVDLKTGSDDLSLNYQSATGDPTKDVLLQFGADAVNTNKVPTLLYFHPGRKQEVINSTIFLYKALEFYSKEFSSFPFTSYTLLFIDGLSSDICSFAGMTIASSKLLYGPKLIEPMFETTEKLSFALAEQYSGVNVLPKTLNDIWLTLGIAGYMGYQFLKKLFGVNYYRFLFQKRSELLCDLDIGKRPLSNQLFKFPINADQDLDFIRLKAPLVLTILDRRITKTDKLFGLLRVIPKIFLQAMSNDLINGNNLSTGHFQRVCEKVAHHKLESFFQNWIHNSGVPTLRITQKFNKKRLFIEMSIRQMQASNLNNIEDNIIDENIVRQENCKSFVDDANTYLVEEDHFGFQPSFSGPITIRIHETDGSPYEHILAISDPFTKLDIQYNTKYRRKKKERREGTEDFDDNEREKEKEKDSKRKDKVEENKVNMLGDVLLSSEELRNWDLKEEEVNVNEENGEMQNQADEDKDEAFEWLRFDADSEWICRYTINLTDEKFEAQLKQDRDVEAQYESVKHFGNVNRPTLTHARILLRTLIDSRYFYGIRIEAAKALAKISTEENDHIGMRFLLKTFKYLYCYDNKIISGYNEFDPKEYLPKPNDFSNFTNLFICQAILESLGDVKNKNGDSPIELKRIMLNLLKYNDNSINKFDDSQFYCALIKSVCNHIIFTNREIPDLHMDERTAFIPKDAKDEFLFGAISELNRCLKLDQWSPSYQNRVTKVVLEQKIRFVRAGLARLSFMDLIKYTVSEFNDEIRLIAFNGLLLIGGFRNSNILNYYFTTMRLDESPFIRYQLNKSLVHCIGIAATSGIPSLLDDDEFLKAASSEDTNSDVGNRLIRIEESASGKFSLQSRKDELIRNSIKRSVDLIRSDLGMGRGLNHELWDTVHSCLVPINTRRNIFDIMMVLYEPKDSFIVTTRLPSDKQIVVKVKNKVLNTSDTENGSLIVSFKREAKFKIQLPAIKFKINEDKLKKQKASETDLIAASSVVTSPVKKPRKKKNALSPFVSVDKSATKFEIAIKLPITKKLFEPVNSNHIIIHDRSLPPRYVRIDIRTKKVLVSTNEDFDPHYIPREYFVSLKVDRFKLKELFGSEITSDNNLNGKILVKHENTVDVATAAIVDTNGESEKHVNSDLPVTIKVEVTDEDEMTSKNINEINENSADTATKLAKISTCPETVKEEVSTVSAVPEEQYKAAESSKSPNWQKDSQSIVGKLNPMKRSANSTSPPASISLSLSRSRSRSRSQSPDKVDGSEPKRKKMGPKIKLRLK
jgi:transcription initiation factor TFIID subunit 2